MLLLEKDHKTSEVSTKKDWCAQYRQCSHRQTAKGENIHGQDIISSTANNGTFLAYRTGNTINPALEMFCIIPVKEVPEEETTGPFATWKDNDYRMDLLF